MSKPLVIGAWFLFFAALIFAGFAAVLFFHAELLAKTDSRGMDRLFSRVGVIKVQPNKDPVNFNLKDINGNNISLSDFNGKIVFLNFWTTLKCRPWKNCIKNLKIKIL
jgi:cytochrome oxidase Cu insertion factor (SCO1/SenC/PrrC family)